MNPGRELDAFVAEKVIGHKNIRLEYGLGGPAYSQQDFVSDPLPGTLGVLRRATSCPVPNYSTNIAAAWELVHKLSHRNFSFISHHNAGMSGSAKTPNNKGWMALFHIEGGPMDYTYGKTAPHAICAAALRAVGHKE